MDICWPMKIGMFASCRDLRLAKLRPFSRACPPGSSHMLAEFMLLPYPNVVVVFYVFTSGDG